MNQCSIKVPDRPRGVKEHPSAQDYDEFAWLFESGPAVPLNLPAVLAEARELIASWNENTPRAVMETDLAIIRSFLGRYATQERRAAA